MITTPDHDRGSDLRDCRAHQSRPLCRRAGVRQPGDDVLDDHHRRVDEHADRDRQAAQAHQVGRHARPTACRRRPAGPTGAASRQPPALPAGCREETRPATRPRAPRPPGALWSLSIRRDRRACRDRRTPRYAHARASTCAAARAARARLRPPGARSPPPGPAPAPGRPRPRHCGLTAPYRVTLPIPTLATSPTRTTAPAPCPVTNDPPDIVRRADAAFGSHEQVSPRPR